MADNIYEELRKDHEAQRTLLTELTETSGDSNERQSLFDLLKKNLQDHAKFEERFFYAELMQEDMVMEKARHSVHEHHEIDEQIEKLESIEFSSPQWLVEAKNLQELVEHHLKEEEQETFQLSGKVLTDAQKKNLGQSYHKEMHT